MPSSARPAPSSPALPTLPADTRVLCVDDNRDQLDMLALMLRAHCQVHTAPSGAAALALLEREPDIAVVISDMRMPDLGGAELLARVRELRPQAARILLTGQADLQTASEAVRTGQLFRLLLKPCPEETLLEAVASGAAQFRAARREAQDLRRRDDELRYLAWHDPLTRLANRELFLERTQELVRAAQAAGTHLAVMLVDLRHFRYLNDTLGRERCNEILRLVAARLLERAPAPTRVARVGSDRFAVAIAEPIAGDAAALMASPLCDPLDLPIPLGTQSVQLSGTVGLAFFPEDGDDADALLYNAEAAMKSAKAAGVHARVYTRELGSALSSRIRIERRLQEALNQRQFALHYQPKVDLRSGAVCGAEALLRWHSPELGMVPPTQFVPVLEESGLILEAGDWALRQAAADRRAWLAAGLPAVPVAVNVSARQLRMPDFVDRALQALGADSGITLEITESMLMSGVEEAIAKLARLRAHGICIAIDDFGTGYSSLSYLARLPVDAVKIDRSFVTRIGESADTLAVVSAVIALARTLHLRVIAEGVDSEEQLKFVRLLRCDVFQGHLFSPALPAAAFADLLRSGRRQTLPG